MSQLSTTQLFLTTDKLPEVNVPVIGYSTHWVHPDFNPKGVRECFRTDDGNWISSGWDDYHDCYSTIFCEGPEMWAEYPDPLKTRVNCLLNNRTP